MLGNSPLTNNEKLSELLQQTVIPLIRGYDRHICIIDVPNYPNVGDSAIFLGQMNLLRNSFPNSKFSFFDRNTYTSKANILIENSSVIIINGGGNFGDIWPDHYSLRKDILKNFKKKRIIQLPQSIFFLKDSFIKEISDLISACADFHMITRDKKSESFARNNFNCNVLLAPDSAFCMDEVRSFRPKREFLCLLRRDIEAIADHDAIIEVIMNRSTDYEIVDWLDETNTFIKRLDEGLAFLTRKRPHWTWFLQGVMLHVRERYARDRLRVGIDMLSRGEVVVTDRLHAHILCCLLRIPHIFLNPLDSKIEAFYRTWTHVDDIARFAASPVELEQILASDWLLRHQAERGRGRL